MSILRSASPELFFLTLQETTRQEELNSMVVGIEVNKKTRFLAWVKASVRGDLVTCEFRCAEFQLLGRHLLLNLTFATVSISTRNTR